VREGEGNNGRQKREDRRQKRERWKMEEENRREKRVERRERTGWGTDGNDCGAIAA
jgi:hypothetical protein